MATLLELTLRSHPFAYITDNELEALIGGTPDSRHSMVKRALAKGDLMRIKRGLYCLGAWLHPQKPHPFELAQKIYSPSYISLESALSYHQLIPEAVHTITCVTPKRAQTFTTPLGEFKYFTLPQFNFFMGVERREENTRCFFMATPWKAITDYVYCYKKEWQGINPLIKSLRIEVEDLPKPNAQLFAELGNYYKSRRIINFLKELLRDLNHLSFAEDRAADS